MESTPFRAAFAAFWPLFRDAAAEYISPLFDNHAARRILTVEWGKN
jgi:hypothetical protein